MPEDINNPNIFAGDAPLLRVSPDDIITIRDSFVGWLILGETGSGKTSSSGMMIRAAMLRAGFGGLVLVDKADEAESWDDAAAAQRREPSVLKIGPGHPHALNILNYCLNRPGRGAGIISNLVTTLVIALEGEDAGRGASDPYWRQARDQFLRNAFTLIYLATGTLTWDDMLDVLASLPQHPQDVEDPEWTHRSRCSQLLRQAYDRNRENESAMKDLEAVARYFLIEFATLDVRPRSSVMSMVGSLTDMLSRSHVRDLFLSKTTFVPEVIYGGAIIVFDMPVQQFGDAGRFAQKLFKTIVQQMLERRAQRDESARPVFVWADEGQQFITSNDQQFQAIARSSRVATVLLTQNIPNLNTAFGPHGRDAAMSLAGCLGLKVFHNNGDPDTLKYAEQIFGQDLVQRESVTAGDSATRSPNGGSRTSSFSRTWNWVVDSVVRGKHITELKRGGPRRRFAEALMFRAGEPWRATGSNVLLARFPQVLVDKEMYE